MDIMEKHKQVLKHYHASILTSTIINMEVLQKNYMNFQQMPLLIFKVDMELQTQHGLRSQRQN